MYPSSASSSSQSSYGTTNTGGGLVRYDSAPSSLLATTMDSIIGPTRDFSALAPPRANLSAACFFPSEASESADMRNQNDGGVVSRTRNPIREDQLNGRGNSTATIGLQRSYGFNPPASAATGGGIGGGGSSSGLIRQSSSPAGFLNHLATTVAAADNGFSVTKGIGSYNTKGVPDNTHSISRLNSQLSFTRQESLSRIFEETDGIGTDTNGQRKSSTHSYSNAGFAMGSWDDTNPMMFSVGSSKRAKTSSNGPDAMETQFQFGITESALEMATMENLLHIPQDSVPCKIRAKRGFATHPRSIAERERRTRISGKLKKLQDLVPNMDKQTSYSDMLDLAVQHINSLQEQLKKLNKEHDNCKCGCKNSGAEHK